MIARCRDAACSCVTWHDGNALWQPRRADRGQRCRDQPTNNRHPYRCSEFASCQVLWEEAIEPRKKRLSPASRIWRFFSAWRTSSCTKQTRPRFRRRTGKSGLLVVYWSNGQAWSQGHMENFSKSICSTAFRAACVRTVEFGADGHARAGDAFGIQKRQMAEGPFEFGVPRFCRLMGMWMLSGRGAVSLTAMRATAGGTWRSCPWPPASFAVGGLFAVEDLQLILLDSRSATRPTRLPPRAALKGYQVMENLRATIRVGA